MMRTHITMPLEEITVVVKSMTLCSCNSLIASRRAVLRTNEYKLPNSDASSSNSSSNSNPACLVHRDSTSAGLPVSYSAKLSSPQVPVAQPERIHGHRKGGNRRPSRKQHRASTASVRIEQKRSKRSRKPSILYTDSQYEMTKQ